MYEHFSLAISFVVWYNIDDDKTNFEGRTTMDIHTTRQQLKTKSIYDLPMRVTFYARVSS